MSRKNTKDTLKFNSLVGFWPYLPREPYAPSPSLLGGCSTDLLARALVLQLHQS